MLPVWTHLLGSIMVLAYILLESRKNYYFKGLSKGFLSRIFVQYQGKFCSQHTLLKNTGRYNHQTPESQDWNVWLISHKLFKWDLTDLSSTKVSTQKGCQCYQSVLKEPDKILLIWEQPLVTHVRQPLQQLRELQETDPLRSQVLDIK